MYEDQIDLRNRATAILSDMAKLYKVANRQWVQPDADKAFKTIEGLRVVLFQTYDGMDEASKTYMADYIGKGHTMEYTDSNLVKLQELGTELREHFDTDYGSDEEKAAIRAWTHVKIEASDAKRAAEEAVPFPVYEDHPDWPEKFSKVMAEIREGEKSREWRNALDRFTVQRLGLINEVKPLQRGASEAYKQEPERAATLKRSRASFERSGGTVERIRRTKYAEYNNARATAGDEAYNEIVDGVSFEVSQKAERAERSVDAKRAAAQAAIVAKFRELTA